MVLGDRDSFGVTSRNGKFSTLRRRLVLVVDANRSGTDGVAIGNEFSPSDRLMNLVRRAQQLQVHPAPGGTVGCPGPDCGCYLFSEWRSDAFCNPAFSRFLQERGIGEVIPAGLFARACVAATAKGALARGLKVSIGRDAVADASNRAREAALNHLAR